MPLPVDVESQPPLLTLACRFIPYDQWLTTHVDASWKVKQVKLWILSKCLGIPLDASMFPFQSSSRAANSDVFDAATQRYRPKSPITFAPDPRTLRRPVSPILFAKGTKKGKDRKVKGKGEDRADDEDENGKNTESTSAGSPTSGEYTQDNESDVVDDGGSSSDELAIYRNSPPPPLPVPPPPRPATPPLAMYTASSKWARYNLSPSAYTLIRFSTGQALEDDLSLTFFDLSSYELLELHAHGDVCAPSQTSASSSISTTSHASISEHHHTGHTRTNSFYTQISGTTAPSPSPSLSHIHLKTKDRDRDKDKDNPSQRIYLVHFPRHDLHKYIQPYWEGPVRELRSVPVRSLVAPMPSFLNGYGYGYSGGDFSERAVALGIGSPPPLPFGMQMQGQGMGMGTRGWDARGGSGAAGGIGGTGEGTKLQHRIEWRPKHVVIKDGLFTLCMSREDPHPRHIIPLEAFTSLRGADTLIAHLRNWGQLQHQKSRTTTTATLASTTSTSASTSSTSHQPSFQYTPPKHKPRPSKSRHQSTRYSASRLGGPVFSTHASDDDSASEIGGAYQRLGREYKYGHGRRGSRDGDGSGGGGGGGGGGGSGGGDGETLRSHGSTNLHSHSHSHSQSHHSYPNPNPTSRPKSEQKLRPEDDNEGFPSSPFSSDNDDDNDDNTPRTIAGEPLEDLRIVVLMYRSVNRMRKVVGVDRDGLVRVGYVRDRDKDKGNDGERGERDKGGGRGRGKGKGKGNDRGRAFPWREKEREKEKEGGKSRRDWIPGFGVKRDRDREIKDKDREKDKERKREAKDRALESGGMGMGVGIGRGLQDVRGQMEKEKEKGKEKEAQRERVALSGVDAEAKIVFARRSETNVSSEDEEGGVGEEEGAVEEGDEEGEEEGQSTRDRMIKNKAKDKDRDKAKKGKGKAKIVAGEVDGGTDADVDCDGDSDLDADRGGDANTDDLSFSRTRLRIHARHKSDSHAHPHIELASSSATLTPSADGGSESETWSSPVFAHSDNTTELGSDVDLSDIGRGGSRAYGHGYGAEAYRYGYRYGYQGPGFGLGAGAGAGMCVGLEEGGTGVGVGMGVEGGAESVGEEKDRLEKERANLERRRQKERAWRREEEARKEEEKTEWIILDVGNDLAYRSFLRVLHRHLAPRALSDFIPSVPVFSITTPTSATPTQTPTPFPSPTSPHAGVASQNFQWFPSSDEDTPMDSTSTFTAFSRHDSHPSPISASSEASGQEFPQHPAALASLSRSGKKTSQPFGVLPYPEWRLELTERAQRAGMGNIGRALKWVRWEHKAQLELDVEELLRRYSASDDASDKASRESIRKKKRKATSLKNRRKSTTSTLTEGKSSGRSGLKDWDREGEEEELYDSDVSEDTGKMLEMSDSEEGSEAEWHGWMADLHRQRQTREQRAWEEVQRGATEPTEAAAAFEVPDGQYREPIDGTEIRNRRVMLEPKGVISVRAPDGSGLQEKSGLSISQSTSAALYSPSSSDSLRRAALSPIDHSSSPAGTFANSQTSRGSSLSRSPLGFRQHTIPVGSTLSHSTSMYAFIRSDAHAEQNLRRPSMPTLASEQMFSLHRGTVIAPQSSVIRSPIVSNFAFPSMTHSPPYSPSFSSSFSFPAEEAASNAASSSRSPSEPSSALSRRASSAGLTNPGGSISRSTSVLTRGSLLRRDAGKEAERFREKERRKEEKAKEKEDKAKEKERAKEFEREAKEARKLQRPKLSLATSSTHQLVPQPATGVVRTNPAISGSSLVRRVKSGSNLNEENIADEARISNSAKDGNASQKKKRLVNRIVRKFDSAMDFVDGRQ